MPNRSPCIFVNDSIISHTQQRGVSRYFREILAGIITQFGDNAVIFSPELGNYSPAKYIRAPRFHSIIQRLRVVDILASVAAYRERAAVLFSPYYGDVWTTAAEVFTVYDMVHELFPQYYHPVGRQLFVAEKKRCFERAAILIAISESTAKDMVTIYPYLDATKIVVIHLGVDEFFFEGCNQQGCRGERPFLLYVGRRTHCKNFLRLLVAFGQSGLAKEFDLRVISPTGGNFSKQEAEYIEGHRLQGNIQLIVGASEETLRDSYAGAVVFVYPSEHEGFGLPILEAMASGTLVATSNVSSMPEVGGDVAFYFDPYKVESIVECLKQVVDLPAQQRRDHIAQGIARAKMFTWTRCRQQTVDVLCRLALSS